jgi:RNA polymerase sigma factor for flagellar operon FliA
MTAKASIEFQWDEWITNQDQNAANELIKHYMYLVNFHVERIYSHLPVNVSKDDILSAGLVGLYDALKKFEPARDLKFDTYASFRIRGSIMDGLRKEDWLSRTTREKTKRIEQISHELEQIYHRLPLPEEIAVAAGMSTMEVETAIKDSLFSNIMSIEEKPKGESNRLKEGVGYSIPDESALLPEKHVLQNEVKEELKTGIQSLTANEQIVISLIYKEDLTLTEIGQVLDLTTSRISQIHKKAIFKLKKELSSIQ